MRQIYYPWSRSGWKSRPTRSGHEQGGWLCGHRPRRSWLPARPPPCLGCLWISIFPPNPIQPRILPRGCCQSDLDGIVQNVLQLLEIIFLFANEMIEILVLPNLPSDFVGGEAFDAVENFP